MNLTKVLIGIEVLTLFSAALLPNQFVSSSAALAQLLFAVSQTSIAYSYAALVLLVCAAGAIARKLSSPERTRVRGKGPLILNFLSVLGAGLMAYSMAAAGDRPLAVDEVISPYSSYLLSVFFSMGVGYALADLVFFIFSKD